jgi:hypothetical protein
MIERWLTLSQKMESKPQLLTRSDCLLERIILALAQRLFASVCALGVIYKNLQGSKN